MKKLISTVLAAALHSAWPLAVLLPLLPPLRPLPAVKPPALLPAKLHRMPPMPSILPVMAMMLPLTMLHWLAPPSRWLLPPCRMPRF